MTVFLDLMGTIIENDRSAGTRPEGFTDPQDTDELKRMYADGELPHGYYVLQSEDVVFCQDAKTALLHLSKIADLIVVTNCEAIELGLTTEEQYRKEVIQHIESELQHDIKGWYICPHLPESKCACRKPLPKMLFDAADKHGIDLSTSWMVGDAVSDIQAGKAAGCQTIHIRHKGMPKSDADYAVSSLHAAWIEIMQFKGSKNHESNTGRH